MKVLTGKAFAFIHREIATADLDTNDHLILCALGQAPEINGFTLPKLPLPPGPNMCIATCDKELYYEQRDSVNLMLYAPGRDKLDLQLRQGSMMVSQHQPTLGKHGEGQLSFAQLPVGDYQVTCMGECLCDFKVAAYTLAPLVGTLVSRVKESDNILRVTLKVESYGRPLEGGLWVTLRSGYGRQRRTYALATGGIVEALLEFDQDAAYALDLQHAEDTELTATVPLPGTKRSERRDVLLSPLTPVWGASLLPSPDSREVRELHVKEIGNPMSPFRLEGVDGRTATLTANRPVAPLKVAVLDVTNTTPTVLHRDRIEEGESLEIDLPSPMALLAIGAYLDDQPWEAMAMTVAPTELACDISLPQTVRAGEPVELQLQTATEGALYLLVKDARLACRERPGDRLASRLMECARALHPTSGPVQPRNTKDQQQSLEDLMNRIEVSEIQREQARRQARWTEHTAEEILMSVKGLTRQEFIKELWGVELAELGTLDLELARYVPEDLARRYRVVPLTCRGNTLVLAMSDPSNIIAIDDIRLITGYDIEPVLADDEAIMRALNVAYGVTDFVEVEETVKDISAQDFGPLEFDDDDDEEIALDRLKETFTEAPAYEDLDEPAENDQAEVLFAGWVQTENGRATLSLKTPGQPTEITVEAFVASGFDWCTNQARFQTEKPLILSLDCPPFIHPQDEVVGALRIIAGQPPFRLQLTRDDQPVELPQVHETLKPLTFACTPGHYKATVEEIITGHTETIEVKVEKAGRLTGLKRTVQWLRKGDRLDRRLEPGILALQLMDDIQKPTLRLGTVTTNYSHHCCEQTAAKILAAVCLWLADPTPRLEAVIRAGIEREKLMHLPGRGFALYPGYSEPNNYWGVIAAQYLCQLELLQDRPLSPEFAVLVREGVEMGKDALKANGGSWPPTQRSNGLECYLEYRFGHADPELVKMAKSGFSDQGWGGVGKRCALSYQAAILLRSGQIDSAVPLINEVLQSANEQGGLYSTADSIAALLMLEELKNHELQWSGPRTEYEEGQLVSISAAEGDVMVEVTRAFSEDWSEFESNTRLEARLEPAVASAGRLVKLELNLPDGYLDGDLVWLCLPRSLAQLQGGGQLRQFSMDFEGKNKLTLNLVALAPTEGETVLICLRNMFREERIGLAEPLRRQVMKASMGTAEGVDVPAILCTADLTLGGLRGAPETVEQLQTLSRQLHQPELAEFLESLVQRALERDAQKLILDLVDEGTARCRLKTTQGMKVLARYPSPVQALLVGRLQMMSRNALGTFGPQEGEVQLQSGTWPVSILPTSLGMMATLVLQRDKQDKLAWLRVLSQLQQDLSLGRPLDLDALRQARPEGENPDLDALMEVLETNPVSKRHALAALARLAKG